MTAFSKPGVDVTVLQEQVQASKAKTAAGKIGAAAQGQKVPEGIKQAGEDFESMFIAQLLKPMFKGIETDSMFGGGPGEDVYKEMMVEEYGKAISRAGGIGIAEEVQSELLKLQEAGRK
jgi:Rod binding domain-containing protein